MLISKTLNIFKFKSLLVRLKIKIAVLTQSFEHCFNSNGMFLQTVIYN